jgi:uncharacterized protein YerC
VTNQEIDKFLDHLFRPVQTAMRTRLKQVLRVCADNTVNEAEVATLRLQVADLARERYVYYKALVATGCNDVFCAEVKNNCRICPTKRESWSKSPGKE